MPLLAVLPQLIEPPVDMRQMLFHMAFPDIIVAHPFELVMQTAVIPTPMMPPRMTNNVPLSQMNSSLIRTTS